MQELCRIRQCHESRHNIDTSHGNLSHSPNLSTYPRGQATRATSSRSLSDTTVDPFSSDNLLQWLRVHSCWQAGTRLNVHDCKCARPISIERLVQFLWFDMLTVRKEKTASYYAYAFICHVIQKIGKKNYI